MGPLINLTKKDVAFVWDMHTQTAFDRIKHQLVSAPVLALPDFNKQFEVHSDSSIKGIGAVLIQEERQVAYTSRALKPAEINYGTPEQELLAVVNALTEWRCCLEGVEFLDCTDHNPLTFFKTQPTLSRRQARWQLYLSRIRYSRKFKPGPQNVVADALSRATYLQVMERRSNLPRLTEFEQEVSKSYGQDEFISRLSQTDKEQYGMLSAPWGLWYRIQGPNRYTFQ